MNNVKTGGGSMINFDEEIKKFQPSVEIDDAEDTIYGNNIPDVTDIINAVLGELGDIEDKR